MPNEEVVVYVRLYGRDALPMSVQPLCRFLGHKKCGDECVPRFRYLGKVEPD